MNIVTVLEQQVLTLMFGLPVSSACLAVLSCIIDTESMQKSTNHVSSSCLGDEQQCNR